MRKNSAHKTMKMLLNFTFSPLSVFPKEVFKSVDLNRQGTDKEKNQSRLVSSSLVLKEKSPINI